MMDEDFIERTLRERRSLPDALADMLAKYNCIASGIERSMLERMIDVMKGEIALRQNSLPATQPHSADAIGTVTLTAQRCTETVAT